MRIYALLVIAVATEVVGTTALAQSNGFTKPVPVAVTLVAYGLSFYFLSLCLRVLPAGVVYAIWSGLGIMFITIIGWVWLRQALDGPAIVGIGLILAGVVVLNVFSTSVTH